MAVPPGALAAAAASGATVGADEVPYVQTPQNVVDAMLDIAGVPRQRFLIDLGSGDGRIVITAAKKFGTTSASTTTRTSSNGACGSRAKPASPSA